MHTDDHGITGATVAFCATAEFIAALDQAAVLQGMTRSHLSRKLIAAHLREVGLLAPGSPMTPKASRRRAQLKQETGRSWQSRR